MRETERLVRRVVSNAGHCPFDVDRLVDLFADFGQRPVDAYFILVDLEELFKIHIPDARVAPSITVTVPSLVQLGSLPQ